MNLASAQCAFNFAPSNVKNVGGAGTANGGTHAFECVNGFSPTGVATCNNNDWDNAESCVETCHCDRACPSSNFCYTYKDCQKPCSNKWASQRVVYVIKDSGKCADVGVDIQTESDCKAASTALRNRGETDWPKDVTDNINVNFGTAPDACYLDTAFGNPMLRFNQRQTVEKNCESKKKCLCKMVCKEREYQDENDQTTCKSCGSGFYSLPGQLSCSMDMSTCPTGMIGTNDGNTVCRNCPAGYYNDEVGKHELTTSCTECPIGRYTNTVSKGRARFADCYECHVGRYQNEKSQTSCKLCRKGFFSSVKGVTTIDDCDGCPIGWFQEFDGKSSCKLCPVGKYGDLVEVESCKACEAGLYGPSEGLQECLQCPQGWYNDENDQVTCKGCTTGKYGGNVTGINKTIENVACELCQIGLYSNEVGNLACKNCRAGYYNNEVGMRKYRDCKSCSKGKYSKEVGQTNIATCIDCAQGYYNDANYGMGACKGCSTGKFGSGIGFTESSQCEDCTVAKYNNYTGRTSCIDCWAGFYSDEKSLVHCKGCPTGKYGDVTGKSTEIEACKNCTKGKWQNKLGQGGVDKCKDCPKATYGNIMGQTLEDDCI
jgi:hypothetical protein